MLMDRETLRSIFMACFCFFFSCRGGVALFKRYILYTVYIIYIYICIYIYCFFQKNMVPFFEGVEEYLQEAVVHECRRDSRGVSGTVEGKHQVDADNQNGWFLSCKVGD